MTLLELALQLSLLVWFLYAAYAIRMYSIEEFGTVIHEFDPWFNYRAAEYMAQHGRRPLPRDRRSVKKTCFTFYNIYTKQ